MSQAVPVPARRVDSTGFCWNFALMPVYITVSLITSQSERKANVLVWPKRFADKAEFAEQIRS
jgi:hypothetical protein